MSSAMWFLVPAVLVVLFLIVNLTKRLAADRLQTFLDRRRDSCRLVSRGELVDGNRHISVALALSDGEFYYENSDMQASLERTRIQEVEYEDELATGVPIHGKVLRLRCISQTFEFVLPSDSVRQWQAVMPPHRMSEERSIVAV